MAFPVRVLNMEFQSRLIFLLTKLVQSKGIWMVSEERLILGLYVRIVLKGLDMVKLTDKSRNRYIGVTEIYSWLTVTSMVLL